MTITHIAALSKHFMLNMQYRVGAGG